MKLMKPKPFLSPSSFHPALSPSSATKIGSRRMMHGDLAQRKRRNNEKDVMQWERRLLPGRITLLCKQQAVKCALSPIWILPSPVSISPFSMIMMTTCLLTASFVMHKIGLPFRLQTGPHPLPSSVWIAATDIRRPAAGRERKIDRPIDAHRCRHQ